MNINFTSIGLVSIIGAFLFAPNISVAGNYRSDLEPRYKLLTGGSGKGFCTIEQTGRKVKASIKVINIRPGSAATSWLQFDGETVGRFDGTVADESGEVVFNSVFRVHKRIKEITFDVRDHNRHISNIQDNDDLTTELNQPSNAVTGESIKKGTCSFVNLMNRNH